LTVRSIRGLAVQRSLHPVEDGVVGQVQLQRGNRDPVVLQRMDIRAGAEVAVPLAETQPVIGMPPAIGALLDGEAEVELALARNLYALQFGRCAVGEVQVEE